MRHRDREYGLFFGSLAVVLYLLTMGVMFAIVVGVFKLMAGF